MVQPCDDSQATHTDASQDHVDFTLTDGGFTPHAHAHHTHMHHTHTGHTPHTRVTHVHTPHTRHTRTHTTHVTHVHTPHAPMSHMHIHHSTHVTCTRVTHMYTHNACTHTPHTCTTRTCTHHTHTTHNTRSRTHTHKDTPCMHTPRGSTHKRPHALCRISHQIHAHTPHHAQTPSHTHHTYTHTLYYSYVHIQNTSLHKHQAAHTCTLTCLMPTHVHTHVTHTHTITAANSRKLPQALLFPSRPFLGLMGGTPTASGSPPSPSWRATPSPEAPGPLTMQKGPEAPFPQIPIRPATVRWSLLPLVRALRGRPADGPPARPVPPFRTCCSSSRFSSVAFLLFLPPSLLKALLWSSPLGCLPCQLSVMTAKGRLSSRIAWVRIPVSPAQFPDSGLQNRDNSSSRLEGCCEVRVGASLAHGNALGELAAVVVATTWRLGCLWGSRGGPRGPLHLTVLRLVSGARRLPPAPSAVQPSREGWEGHCPPNSNATQPCTCNNLVCWCSRPAALGGYPSFTGPQLRARQHLIFF